MEAGRKSSSKHFTKQSLCSSPSKPPLKSASVVVSRTEVWSRRLQPEWTSQGLQSLGILVIILFVVVFFVVIAVCYLCHVVIVLVCHVVTKIVLDEMGHLLTLLDEMGLDKMGLDEMGWHRWINQNCFYESAMWVLCSFQIQLKEGEWYRRWYQSKCSLWWWHWTWGWWILLIWVKLATFVLCKVQNSQELASCIALEKQSLIIVDSNCMDIQIRK